MTVRRNPSDPAKAALRAYYASAPIAKPGQADAKAERRDDREERDRDAKVRAYVFARERGLCRICRLRPAQSRHELRFRSLGGKITRANCVALCGSGTTGCHGFAQGKAIRYAFDTPALGAEGTIVFTPTDKYAAEWLKVEIGQAISSPVMLETEVSA